jgi:hypothetical protein
MEQNINRWVALESLSTILDIKSIAIFTGSCDGTRQLRVATGRNRAGNTTKQIERQHVLNIN